MALGDSYEGVLSYREQLRDMEPGTLIGLKAGTMLGVLDLLVSMIDDKDRELETGKSIRSDIQLVPLHKRRKIVDEAPDLQ